MFLLQVFLIVISTFTYVHSSPRRLKLEQDAHNHNVTLPIEEITTTESKEPNEDFNVVDQRQKGKENYRVNLKDVVFIWAPVESLLSTAALLDSQILGSGLEGGLDFPFLDHEEALAGHHPSVVPIVKPTTTKKTPTTTTSTTERSTTAAAAATTENIEVKPDRINTKIRYPAYLSSLFRRKPEELY